MDGQLRYASLSRLDWLALRLENAEVENRGSINFKKSSNL